LSRDGAPRRVRIELCEASGPVAPRHQYSTRILVRRAAPAAPRLTVAHTGPPSHLPAVAPTAPPSPPSNIVHCSQPLALERFERLWADLQAQEALTLGGDLTAGRRDRVGVSFNHVEITLGGGADPATHMRFDYLLPQLRLAAHHRQRAVVDLLKALLPLCEERGAE
jgi:hypothetical protein